MLTARDTVGDRVTGLDAGADDYLVKPFAFEELSARLRALSGAGRPTGRRTAPKLVVGPITLDETARRVTVEGSNVELSPREFSLLECLLRHAGQTLSRDQLLDQAWPFGVAVTPNAVDAYIHYLRDKLGVGRAVHPDRSRRGVPPRGCLTASRADGPAAGSPPRSRPRRRGSFAASGSTSPLWSGGITLVVLRRARRRPVRGGRAVAGALGHCRSSSPRRSRSPGRRPDPDGDLPTGGFSFGGPGSGTFTMVLDEQGAAGRDPGLRVPDGLPVKASVDAAGDRQRDIRGPTIRGQVAVRHARRRHRNPGDRRRRSAS